jgi:hypothetical protein
MAGYVRQNTFSSMALDFTFHEVTGTEQYLRPDKLKEAGILLEAIKTGNFFPSILLLLLAFLNALCYKQIIQVCSL